MIHREISQCDELVALFTPWSSLRAWVTTEIGAAWALGKPIIAIFYRMTLVELANSEQGSGKLVDRNVVVLNEVDRYFAELSVRVRGKPNE
jgi:hypothetical protein